MFRLLFIDVRELWELLSAPGLAIIFEFKIYPSYLRNYGIYYLRVRIHSLSPAVLPPTPTHYSETLRSSLRMEALVFHHQLK